MTNPIDKAQPEALRLAAGLEEGCCSLREWLGPASAELRRLHAEVEALRANAARVGGYFIPLNSTDPFADEVQVQRMRQMEGPPKWAAKLNGRCLNKSGGWEWEPMPSSRDDEFLARCRFDTAAEAIAAVHASMKEKTP